MSYKFRVNCRAHTIHSLNMRNVLKMEKMVLKLVEIQLEFNFYVCVEFL